MKSDEEKLIDDLKSGGESRKSAIASFYKEYSSSINRYFQRQGLEAVTADELMQNTFVNVVRNIDSFRGESRFSAWVWSIARNEWRMYWRAAARRELSTEDFELEGKLPTAEHSAMSVTEQIKECIHRGVDAFGKAHKDYAEVIRLVVVYEWSISDIATYLGKRPGATREYLSQSRKKLEPFIRHCRELLVV
jgi:RNA polymerase sigma-70 factor (ECF subfamily)